MKKLSFLALAAAGMLMVGCADKDVVEEQAVTNTAGEGYVGISIQLPTTTSTTRANDDLTNGKEDEFGVENAYLYLFTGTGEDDAIFFKRYELTNSFAADKEGESTTPTPQTGVTMPNGTAVTSTSVSVCRIDKLDLGSKKLFGYVVVNAQGGLDADPYKGMPFKEFAEMELVAADNGGTLEGIIGDYGLLMTNSPICNKKGGKKAPGADDQAGADPVVLSTLVELEPENIKMTPDEAIAAPAGCIYVERAAAKVTVKIKTGYTASTIDVKNDDEEELAMSLDGVAWQVINTEPKFYNARQIEEDWNPYQSAFYTNHNNSYRFVSLYAFDPQIGAGDHTEGYRTYFAKDIQYSREDATYDKYVAINDADHWLGTNDRSFVPENTFDVEHQTRHNTTQVTIRVMFNEGKPFYTISDDAKYYDGSSGNDIINNKLAAIASDLYNVDAWMKKVAEVASAADMFNKTVKVAIEAQVNVSNSTTGSNNLGYTISYILYDAANAVLEPSVEQKAIIEAAMTADNKKWSDVKAEAEKEVTVRYFKGGYSYYNVRIQHFGIQETPWSSTGAYITKPGTGTDDTYVIDDIYGKIGATINSATYTKADRDANFLGRYGVVRDNWYNIQIDAIKKLGSAEPLPVKDDPTPDDEVEDEYYISAHVHILPWVLRIQNVNL